MKLISFSCFVTLLIVGCNQVNMISKDVVINGHIKNMPDGKIYLYDVAKHQAPIDSTDIMNGSFTFHRKTDKTFFPFEASVRYNDTVTNRFMHGKPIGIINTLDTNIIMSSFYVVNGLTTITGKKTKLCINTITTNKQNDVFNKYVCKDFGYLDYTKRRDSQIVVYKNIIKQYPYSFYLLKRLTHFRAQYTEIELQELLSEFNIEVSTSTLFKEYDKYLAMRKANVYR